MQLDKSAQEKIKSWLDSNRNFAEGVLLFQKYGKNPSLKRLFPGRENRYAGKLAYELGKLIGIKPGAGLETPEKLSSKKPNPVPGKEPGKKLQETGDSIPRIIGALIKRKQEIYNQRSLLHHELKKVPPDSRSENDQRRKEISDRIARISEELDHLAEVQNQYELTKVEPDPELVFGKKEAINPPEIDTDALVKKRLNLLKSIVRDKVQLDYQATKKSKEKNPMPNGPKRTLFEQRIKHKNDQIAEIDKILAV